MHFPFVQEGFVEAEALERVSQRSVSIMKDIGSHMPEDQREGEKIVIKNTFLQVVRKEPGRPRADSTTSVLKPTWSVGSPVHQPLQNPVPLSSEETEVMSRDQFLDVLVVEETWFSRFPPPRTGWI